MTNEWHLPDKKEGLHVDVMQSHLQCRPTVLGLISSSAGVTGSTEGSQIDETDCSWILLHKSKCTCSVLTFLRNCSCVTIFGPHMRVAIHVYNNINIARKLETVWGTKLVCVRFVVIVVIVVVYRMVMLWRCIVINTCWYTVCMRSCWETRKKRSNIFTVVPPVTSIRGLLKKPEVKTQAHSSVQLTAPCFPVSFQSLLPANEKL